MNCAARYRPVSAGSRSRGTCSHICYAANRAATHYKSQPVSDGVSKVHARVLAKHMLHEFGEQDRFGDKVVFIIKPN